MTDLKATRTVRDYMSRELVTLSPEMPIHTAVARLLEHRYSGAPVLGAGGELAGILSIKDCLRIAFGASYHQDLPGTVADYMSSPVQTVDAELDVVEAAELFLQGHFRRYPVLENGQLVGQVSRYDILRAVNDMW